MNAPAVAASLAPTGVLRAAINLGNPVLAQGTPEEPAGVTVELARAVAERLGVPVELLCSDAARLSLEALREGRADLGFLAVEPARAEEVAFTPPYVGIEGVYAVRGDSPVRSADDVDRPGVRIGVKQGSAYDLYLTRTLEHAELVRGAEGTAVFTEQDLDVAAGIRQPVEAFVAATAGLRVLEPRFMQIQQALAVPRDRPDEAVTWLSGLVADLVRDGSVAGWLEASGHDPALVATPT